MTRTDALSIPLPENDQAIQWLWDVKTPGYVFDPSIALARYRRLRELLDTGLIVSLKANSNLELLIRCGHGFVDGVELASLGELDLAVGRIAATKYVNNPSMDETFMRAALASRCVFIIDSLGQAERLAGLMGKQPAPFATRVRAVKTLGGRTVAVCDGGLSHNFLLARTESAIKKYARPRLLRRQPAAGGAAVAPVQYVGSTCSRADIIGWQPDAIAAPDVGDLVIFEQCGAYHPNYSVSGFLSLGAAGAYIHQSGASE
ncbi:hypothetical protein ABD440_02170 [Chromobacterium piscinae]|uniref:hypothetical protein n=1 Tax=Chromobacterium piscinae TaxID=686831 RepID=UPI0031FE41F6